MKDEEKQSITTIIGLGNPGKRFEYTRHNIGFMIIDALADKYNAEWQEKNMMALANIVIDGKSIMLIKPLTFMNQSGSIFSALTKKGIHADHILVVHDELEKPFGWVGIKKGGSARGHNGVRSIIQAIGPEFLRLRFGIGRPENRQEVPDYVLDRFGQDSTTLASHIDHALEVIENII